MNAPSRLWSITGALALVGGLAAARPAADASSNAVAPRQSAPELFEVDGLQVIYRHRPGTGLVAVRVYLLGGARQVTESTAGIEPLLLYASERGTRDYPGAAALEAEVRSGSRIGVGTTPDWTVFSFRGLAEEFEATWSVFADRLMHPTLDPAAVSIARERMLTSRRASGDDPDGEVRAMAAEAAFRGHAYARPVNGTLSSLEGLRIEDLRAYHESELVKSRLLIAVVGDVTREQVEAAAGGTLAALPAGSYAWQPPTDWIADDATVDVRFRDIATNYIAGYFGGPPASSEEYPAFRIALAIMSSIVFSEVRSRGLSYAAGAYPVERAAAGGAVYISTRYPKESIDIVNDVIDIMRQGVLPRSMLRDYAAGWITGYWLDNETLGDQADFLARSYLFAGELRTPEDFVEELRRVAPDAVRRVTNRYIKNIQYAFLGDTTLVPRSQMRRY